MKGDDVAFAQERFERKRSHRGVGRAGPAGSGEDIHAERAGNAADLTADTTVANDPEIQPGEFHQGEIPVAEVRVLGPTIVANRLCMVTDAVGKFEEESEGGLGDRIGAVSRDVGNEDAALPGSGEIDHIDPRGGDADVFELWQGFEGGAVEEDFIGESGVGFVQAREHVPAGGAIVDDAFTERLEFLPGKITGIHGVTIEHDQFHARQNSWRSAHRNVCG